MKDSFAITYEKDGYVLNGNYKAFTFSGGEEHVEISNIAKHSPEKVTIYARVKSSSELFRLLLIKDAIDGQFSGKTKPVFVLVIPYLPYARQDRITYAAAPFSLRVLAHTINSMEFDKVVTCDVHSSVASALIKNLENKGMSYIVPLLAKTEAFYDAVLSHADPLLGGRLAVLVPDEGARKRCEEFVKVLSVINSDIDIIQATKKRDPATGKLLGVEIHAETLEFYSCVIVPDDICDGGGTFLLLAQEACGLDVNKLVLLTTHGIFSKGTDMLERFYDNIFITNSWDEVGSDGFIESLDIFAALKEDNNV